MNENKTGAGPAHDGGDIGGRAGFKKLAVAAARLADSKKAEAVVVYDMAGRSGITDFIVAATVDNPAQLEAVEEEISVNLKKEGVYAVYRDGSRSKNWRVLDYGGLMVHVFERKAREFFDFDKVYENYARVKWQRKAPAPRALSAAAKARGKPAAVRKAKKAVKAKPAARKKK